MLTDILDVTFDTEEEAIFIVLTPCSRHGDNLPNEHPYRCEGCKVERDHNIKIDTSAPVKRKRIRRKRGF